ncbi:MAG: type III secretion fhipep protein [Chloroflexi bacterium]|nr:type III secretion fhipep protein [Chloroflexota bacterium]
MPAQTVRPALVCELLLSSIAVADGRRKRRARNTTPDNVGLDLKLTILQDCITADPDPEDLERWLLERSLRPGQASGPVRAVCADVVFEWQLALGDPYYRDWLLAEPEAESTGA